MHASSVWSSCEHMSYSTVRAASSIILAGNGRLRGRTASNRTFPNARCMYSQILLRFQDLFLLTAELAETAEIIDYQTL